MLSYIFTEMIKAFGQSVHACSVSFRLGVLLLLRWNLLEGVVCFSNAESLICARSHGHALMYL